MAVDKLVDSTQLNADLTSVANAIRAKMGAGVSTPLYFPDDFVDAIEDIEITPQYITGDGWQITTVDGKDYLEAVTTELGTKNISVNGTYNASSDDLDGYSSVTVAVPNSYSAGDEGKVVSSGALVAQTSDTVTQNGTVDTTLINSLTVNVSGSTPTGTKQISISSNGTTTENVSGYASAQITTNVPNSYTSSDEGKVVSNGALVSQTSSSVTQNGTVDTTLINSLNVNVSGGGGSGSVQYGSFTVSSKITVAAAGTSVSVGFTGQPDFIYCWMSKTTFEELGTWDNSNWYRWMLAKKDSTVMGTFPYVYVSSSATAQSAYANATYIRAVAQNVLACSAAGAAGYANQSFTIVARNAANNSINSDGTITIARTASGASYIPAGTYHYFAVTGGMTVFPA